MQFWLMKSEPYKYSWQQLLTEGRTFWDGVRNYQARNNLKAMQEGDQAFFYHSNQGMEIAGVVEIVREHYADPTTADPQWVVVDIAPLRALQIPVSLRDIKENPLLRDMVLVKQSRLSVSPVRAAEWKEILKMAKTQL